ncbi:hypothetical protein EUA66_03075 [TM7 phylum sp. oral taxon 349]|nr:hypothetical protein EUA66_03075 [TM7 phylum sp. oral taxon 349]
MSRPKPTIRQLIRALYSVAKTSLRIAPGMSVLQVTGSAISAGLPIATTYLAALTTTALAEAYAGDRAAGNRRGVAGGGSGAIGRVDGGVGYFRALRERAYAVSYQNRYVRRNVRALLCD